MAAVGLKSQIVLPLKAEGAVVGGLEIASFRAFRNWPPGLVSSLTLLAAVFAGAVRQRRSAQQLRAACELNHSLGEEVRELRDRLDAETVLFHKAALRAQGFDEIVGTSAPLSKVCTRSSRSPPPNRRS
jgi:GAF domain-containing protein